MDSVMFSLLGVGLFLMIEARDLDGSAPRLVGKKCSHTRAHGMIAADCYGLDLTAVPQDLNAGIKVLSLTHNRLRELSCQSFDPYSNLVYLYLDDNIISFIPEGIFSNLFNLEVVDLSLNPLKTIPSDFLTFSKLRRLYLNHNQFGDNALQSLQNITGIVNLQFLSVAYCGLTKIPPLINFLELTELNISGNSLRAINPIDLAPACNLKKLDLNQNDRLFLRNFCGCQRFEGYLNEKNITLVAPYQLNCSEKATQDINVDCSTVVTAVDEVHLVFNSCLYHKTIIAANSSSYEAWKIGIWMFSCIAALVAIITTIYYVYYRKDETPTHFNNLNHPMRYRNDGASVGGENFPLKEREFNITS